MGSVQVNCNTHLLDSNQLAIANRIAQYGISNAYSFEEVHFALKTAFIESSLGNEMSGHLDSTASGLFGYTDKQWQEYHRNNGEKDNVNNQISAFFQDITKYQQAYSKLSESDTSLVNLGEFIYIRHHDGPDAPNFRETSNTKKIWDDNDFHATKIPSAKENKLINKITFSAAIVSLLVNFVIFFYMGKSYITKFQGVVGIFLPGYVGMFIMSVGMLIRGILRGTPRDSFVAMEIEEARAIVLKDDKFIRRLLARLYLLTFTPGLLLGGWVMGSALFDIFLVNLFKK